MSAPTSVPDQEDYGDTSKLPINKLLAYVDQLHKARRAGVHHDIRIGDENLYSWAGRYGVPRPGEKRTLFQQPLHPKEYADFEGEIPEGYGAGTVSIAERGSAVVTEATKNKIKLLLAHRKNPEYFTMLRREGKNRPWLMINTTPQAQGSTKTAEDKTPADYAKDVAIAAGTHRLADSALTYGVRRGGLFQNYYANAAKEGINAALTGQDLLPRWRRSLGIISPSLTGLTDYEVSRGLTHKLLEEAKNQGLSYTPKNIQELTSQNPAIFDSIKTLSRTQKLSPITRNIINAVDPNLPKNRVIEFLRTRGGVGVDRQKNPLFLGAALAGLTGSPHGLAGATGAVLSAAPDLTFGALAQDRDLTKNVEDLKLGLIGTGTMTKKDMPIKSKFIAGALNVLSPSTGEVFNLGQDLAMPLRALSPEQQNIAEKFISQKMIAPGKDAPVGALKNIGKNIGKIFKAGADFTPDYTPRRAYALRNWARLKNEKN
jgi:hypothetical protein